MPHSLFNLADDLRQTPEQAFLTDDSREILRFAVETL
ncbi:XdhC family protein, partial [Leclercia adecarboxylata]|nr:XdhC family protein [Leclercia adecarboxylata]